MIIALDAGHGPETKGKRTPDDSMREFHFNSVVADYVAAGLKEYDVEVIYTHEMDSDVPLRDRTDKANSYKANVFISIHANAYGSGGWNNVQGIETFVHNNSGSEAFDLATKVQTEMLKATGRLNRGVKKSNFHVLRETQMPAILIECGFMTNEEEAELLKSDAYRVKCASAILTVLVNYYNLTKKEIIIVEEKPSNRAREAWEWAIKNNLTDGINPKGELTKEQFITILYRYDNTK